MTVHKKGGGGGGRGGGLQRRNGGAFLHARERERERELAHQHSLTHDKRCDATVASFHAVAKQNHFKSFFTSNKR